MLAAQAGWIIVRDLLVGIPGFGIALQIVLDEVDLLRPARARLYAVEVADLVGEDIKAKVDAQPNRAELLYKGLVLSLDARTAEKIHALAAAVAHGLTSDSTGLEIAYMALEAIGSLDEAQINLLRALATSPPESHQLGGFTLDQIGNRVPALDRRLLNPILSVLQGKGLITGSEAPGVGFVGVDRTLYGITALGEAVNELLDSPIST